MLINEFPAHRTSEGLHWGWGGTQKKPKLLQAGMQRQQEITADREETVILKRRQT